MLSSFLHGLAEHSPLRSKGADEEDNYLEELLKPAIEAGCFAMYESSGGKKWAPTKRDDSRYRDGHETDGERKLREDEMKARRLQKRVEKRAQEEQEREEEEVAAAQAFYDASRYGDDHDVDADEWANDCWNEAKGPNMYAEAYGESTADDGTSRRERRRRRRMEKIVQEANAVQDTMRRHREYDPDNADESFDSKRPIAQNAMIPANLDGWSEFAGHVAWKRAADIEFEGKDDLLQRRQDALSYDDAYKGEVKRYRETNDRQRIQQGQTGYEKRLRREARHRDRDLEASRALIADEIEALVKRKVDTTQLEEIYNDPDPVCGKFVLHPDLVSKGVCAKCYQKEKYHPPPEDAVDEEERRAYRRDKKRRQRQRQKQHRHCASCGSKCPKMVDPYASEATQNEQSKAKWRRDNASGMLLCHECAASPAVRYVLAPPKQKRSWFGRNKGKLRQPSKAEQELRSAAKNIIEENKRRREEEIEELKRRQGKITLPQIVKPRRPRRKPRAKPLPDKAFWWQDRSRQKHAQLHHNRLASLQEDFGKNWSREKDHFIAGKGITFSDGIDNLGATKKAATLAAVPKQTRTIHFSDGHKR